MFKLHEVCDVAPRVELREHEGGRRTPHAARHTPQAAREASRRGVVSRRVAGALSAGGGGGPKAGRTCLDAAPPARHRSISSMAIAARIDLADLGQNLLALIERVRVGDEVVVVERGAVVARIVPPVDARAEARAALAALRAQARVGDVESPLGEAWEAADDLPPTPVF